MIPAQNLHIGSQPEVSRHRQGTDDPDHADPRGATPGDDYNIASAGPAKEGLDMGSLHEAFQNLAAKRGAEDIEPDTTQQKAPPAEEIDDGLTTTFEQETPDDSLDSETGVVDATSASPFAEVTSDEGAARLEEFARIQQQASEPDDPSPSTESSLRKTEFERLRQEALGEDGPPVAMPPP
jgi:hypothetical protein